MKLLDLQQFDRFRELRNVKVLRRKSSDHDLWGLRSEGKFSLEKGSRKGVKKRGHPLKGVSREKTLPYRKKWFPIRFFFD